MSKNKCLHFAKQLQALQELARMDLDLLALSMDLEQNPEAGVEFDKVKQLVHDLLSMEEEVCHSIQILEKDGNDDNDEDEEMANCSKKSSTDWTKFPNQMVRKNSLGNVLFELTKCYTFEEIMDGFDCLLEQSMAYSAVGRLRRKQLLMSNQNLGLSFPARSDSQGNKHSYSNSCLPGFRMPWILAENENMDIKPVFVGDEDMSGINQMSDEASGYTGKGNLGLAYQDAAIPGYGLLTESGESVSLLPPGTSQQRVDSPRKGRPRKALKSAGLQSEVGEKRLGDIRGGKWYSPKKRLHIHQKGRKKSLQEDNAHLDIKVATRKCPHCDKVMRATSLKHHLLSQHSVAKPHACSICGKAFPLKSYLTRHIKTHHSQLQHYGKQLCTVCNKYFYNLSRHTVVHTGERPYQCYTCGLSFTNRDSFNNHERKQHTGVWPHRCATCMKGFLYACELDRHKAVCQKPRKKPVRKPSSHSTSTSTRTYEDLPFKCSMCMKAFKHSRSLAYHSLSHKDELKSCLICKETFNYPSEVEPHVQNHLGQKSFKCQICGEAFYSFHQHSVHQVVHNKDAFKCNFCSFAATSVSSLYHHKRRKHGSSEKKFVCSVCGKYFGYSQELRRHENAHSNIKPHQCGICGMQFRRKAGLKVHEWTHKTIKKYNCDKCDKGFNDKRNLVSHLKTHNEIQDHGNHGNLGGNHGNHGGDHGNHGVNLGNHGGNLGNHGGNLGNHGGNLGNHGRVPSVSGNQEMVWHFFS